MIYNSAQGKGTSITAKERQFSSLQMSQEMFYIVYGSFQVLFVICDVEHVKI